MLGSAVIVVALAAVAAFSAAAGAAESPSALLEKAIYTEETVGDLDAAAKLYEKAVAEAKKIEAVAAKAQYRLGLCLLKQGKKEQGIAALEKVVQRFPGQKELVAAARKHLPATPGLKLRPPMWGEGEVLHYRIKLGGGLEVGAIIYSAEKATLDGKKIWRFRSRTCAGARQVASRVDADFDTFMPISSSWTISGAGEKQ
jgi:tetratricopeptide (TPR) repeat protein